MKRVGLSPTLLFYHNVIEAIFKAVERMKYG